ncbi:acyltransferase [Labilibaculum manganireducens]|uniref:acyltransferase n=1 Tax=Labilibaculum manganireducens TaxID=1940525 RepID=UPI0029F4FFE9|nr:acyltransferase [Labilibaculum manganireducens]
MNNSKRNLWVDYLRSAITVLVVAHHSSLAYTTFARFDNNVYINSTHPIVDSKRWIGLDIFQNFNDVFFMSLMFLIGGLFLMKSINKKGVFNFIRDRFYRLFIPFLFLGTFFMVIAYFPPYHVVYNNFNIVAHIKDFFVIEKWPAGPPWFIWVLFLFNLLFALFLSQFNKASEKIGKRLSDLKNKPLTFFGLLFSISWILYVPIAHIMGAGDWTGIGPFDFQISRILLYFGYFTFGILIGNTDFNNELFSAKSVIVKKWWLWLSLSLAAYFVLTIIGEPLTQLVKEKKIEEINAYMIYYTVYVASCTLSSVAFITVFVRFIHTEKKWWNSLSENAYLIYIVHFIFVLWSQFLLMKFNIPAFVKFLLSFTVSLSLSWLVSKWLRKVKVVKKYL